MTKLVKILILATALLAMQYSSAQGLKFNGAEQAIDKRTSYTVFSSKIPCFRNSFDIAFDLALFPAWKFGYIMRVKNQKSRTIYNLFYDEQDGIHTFRLNEEGRSSLIIAKINNSDLANKHWIGINIEFDLQNNTVNLSIDKHTFTKQDAGLPDKYYPDIVFGKSDHIIDVPSFAIRNLRVGDNPKHYFELRESQGDAVHNLRGNIIGEVINPEWLINDAYRWRFISGFSSKTVAGANYNDKKNEIYYFNRDAIQIYNVHTRESRTHTFAKRCPVPLMLGTNFISPQNDRLYAYEIYRNVPPFVGPTMASLDLQSMEWREESQGELPTQLHHHSSYMNDQGQKYTIFGGFGNMLYSNKFHTFDLNDQKWTTSDSLAGDPLFPRYFSSTGYSPNSNSLYIFGGMGNESGEQVVGRNYFYDLHRIDLTTRSISKLWEIAWDKSNAVPVRGMVMGGDSCFYTLCYPESFSDSFLRLYRFSIKDGSYQILGDSIPIHSDKITTNANIYYDARLNNLYATVQEFEDDIISDLKIYSLSFPPITAGELIYNPRKNRSGSLLMIISSIIACLVGGLLTYRYARAKGQIEGDHYLKPNIEGAGTTPSLPNSVNLFGDFMVRDRHNKDITYMFSARLKQTFCLILQYSTDEGISSQKLSNLLWPDRPEANVKNSRGVTINHLRKTLSELDGVELIYEKGFFKLIQQPPFYCDYTRSVELLALSTEENHLELINILGRGKFLKFSNQPLFDGFKQEVEHKLVPVLLLELERSFDAESYQTTLDISRSLFDIDPLNDDALAYQTKALIRLKLFEEARLRHQSFMMEYKNTMGKEYPHQFTTF